MAEHGIKLENRRVPAVVLVDGITSIAAIRGGSENDCEQKSAKFKRRALQQTESTDSMDDRMRHAVDSSDAEAWSERKLVYRNL
jgi:hypothetical protein